jgi:murein DD-endopeptidase MepM/ murein hydrolase activator NlpD
LHAGIDLRADYEIVHSIANGIIVKEDYEPRARNYLVIVHGDGIESMLCHLSKFLCKPGDVISAGEVFAISGSTGVVTGPHLHFVISQLKLQPNTICLRYLNNQQTKHRNETTVGYHAEIGRFIISYVL